MTIERWWSSHPKACVIHTEESTLPLFSSVSRFFVLPVQNNLIYWSMVIASSQRALIFYQAPQPFGNYVLNYSALCIVLEVFIPCRMVFYSRSSLESHKLYICDIVLSRIRNSVQKDGRLENDFNCGVVRIF